MSKNADEMKIWLIFINYSYCYTKAIKGKAACTSRLPHTKFL